MHITYQLKVKQILGLYFGAVHYTPAAEGRYLCPNQEHSEQGAQFTPHHSTVELYQTTRSTVTTASPVDTCQHYMSATDYFNNPDLIVNLHFKKKYTFLPMSLSFFFFSQFNTFTNKDTCWCRNASHACHLNNPPALNSPPKIFISPINNIGLLVTRVLMYWNRFKIDLFQLTSLEQIFRRIDMLNK
jgi:hypothetical protein